MNTHFHQEPVMASSGGASGVGIPGFCLVIDENLNYQMKRPVDNVLNDGKTLLLELKQREFGKIIEIKNGSNPTIQANGSSNSTILPYPQTNYSQF